MKILLCFSLLLVFIFPLFNVQKDDMFALEGVSALYFVKNDNGKQYYEKQEKLDFSQSELANLDGIIMTFENLELETVAKNLNLKKVKQELVDDMEIIYGYSDLYDDFIYIDGKQTNVQMLKKQNEVIVGFPIILSGF